MASYTLFCGDNPVCTVSHKTEIPQALSKQEQDEIQAKARMTVEYKQFDNWVGNGFLEIKLKL